jgi:glycosyl transferase, family 25
MQSSLKFVCISLPDSSARRDAMRLQFEKNAIDFRFFDACRVEGDVEARADYDAKAVRRRYGRSLRSGEVGCYLSHLAVWRQLLASSDEAWCVLEDDVILANGFKAVTEELYAARSHWDVVRLMGLFKSQQIPYCILPGGVQLMWMRRPPAGTQCYVITREAAQALVEHASRIRHPIDIVIDRQWRHGLRLFVTSPEFVAENNVESTIGNREVKRTLSLRLREKLHRRTDKFIAAFFNRKRLPRTAIRLTSASDAAD